LALHTTLTDELRSMTVGAAIGKLIEVGATASKLATRAFCPNLGPQGRSEAKQVLQLCDNRVLAALLKSMPSKQTREYSIWLHNVKALATSTEKTVLASILAHKTLERDGGDDEESGKKPKKRRRSLLVKNTLMTVCRTVGDMKKKKKKQPPAADSVPPSD
jgi:hypothetical protein